jgi:hypothetical protein
MEMSAQNISMRDPQFLIGKNFISQILNEEGAWIQDHDGKANQLWTSFRNSLGISAGIVMHFDLPSILNHDLGLSDLVAPFEILEIDNLIRKLPADKAPGSDGFNGIFMKKFWPFIVTPQVFN